MNENVRRGLISVAVAVGLLVVAVVPGRAGATRPPVGTRVAAVLESMNPMVSPTYAATVVCDEGLPPQVYCLIPVPLPAGNAQGLPLEATTYDQTALAGEDYVGFSARPVDVPDPAQNVAIPIDLVDDPICEPPEQFLVAVTGPQLQVIVPVLVLDNDC